MKLKKEGYSTKHGGLIIEYTGDEDEFDWLHNQLRLTQVLEKKNPEGYWLGRVKNFGWRNQDGHKFFRAMNARDLFSQVLPNCDCHFKVYHYGKGIAIQNWHHDSPMGNEWYYISPISENTYYKGKGE
jgi:hypothetical protein